MRHIAQAGVYVDDDVRKRSSRRPLVPSSVQRWGPMMKGYIVSGTLGVMITVAFYEGMHGLAKNTVRAVPGARTAQCAGPGEAIETARQQLADSLMRCQQELIEKEHGAGASGDIGHGTAGDAADGALASGNVVIGGGAEEPNQDRTDPSIDEWRELAKKGELRFNRPCPMEADWVPDGAALASAGLDARDAPKVAEAYRLASARASEVALANCAAWLGADPATVARIGAENCESILDDQAEKVPGLFRRVAEIRAGIRNESESQSAPMDRYFLAKTREWQTFESELARRVGADRAKRITQSPSFCMNDERWPSPPDTN